MYLVNYKEKLVKAYHVFFSFRQAEVQSLNKKKQMKVTTVQERIDACEMDLGTHNSITRNVTPNTNSD